MEPKELGNVSAESSISSSPTLSVSPASQALYELDSQLNVIQNEYSQFSDSAQSGIVGHNCFATGAQCCGDLQSVGCLQSVSGSQIGRLLSDNGPDGKECKASTVQQQV